MKPIARGAVLDGYRFLGGDPANHQSWEAEGLSRGSVQDGFVYLGGDPSDKANWGEGAGVGRTLSDIALKGAQGVVGLGESVVGVADLATGGLAGEGLAAIGYDPKRTKAAIGEGLSASQQISDRNVADAQGFADTMGTVVQNPRSILGSVAESAPSMLGAGGVSSLVARRVFERAALAAGGASTAAGQAAGRAAVEAASKQLMWAGAGAEGALTAGQIAEQARQENPDDPASMYYGVPAGLATAAIGRVAGKLLGDAETAVFTGAKSAGVTGSIPARIAKGAISEGVLEEMPQSAQEQAFQNLATGRPVDEGVGNAAAMGLVTGGAMGGGMASIQGRAIPPAEIQAQAAQQKLAEAATVPEMIQAAGELANGPLDFPPADEAQTLLPTPPAQALESMPGVQKEPPAGSIEYEPQALVNTDSLQLAPVDATGASPVRPQMDPAIAAAIEAADQMELQEAAAARQVEERRRQIEEGPVDRAPRKRVADGVEIDPVAAYINTVGRTNTPAARAFMQEVRAGRITRQDIVRVMQTQQADPMASIQPGQDVDPVQQRIERAAAQAPAPGTGIEPARVYRSRSAAFVQARKTGGTVQPADGGFIIATGETNAQPDLAVPASVPAGAGDAAAPDAGRSVGDLGPQPGGDRGGVGSPAAAPVVSGRAADAARNGDQRNPALKDANETAAEAQGTEAPAPAGADAATQAGVPAARGAGDVQAAGLSLAANGKPYLSKSIAFVRARRQGGTAVEVPGGWAVRMPGQEAAAAPVAGQKIDSEWTAFSKESGTKEVPRAEMPQIKAEHRGAMTQFLAARGIAHKQSEMPAAELKPTQAEFSPAKVAQAREFSGGDRSILVSSDGFILDGHHQWLAKREADEPVKVIRLDAPIEKLMAEVKEFPSAEVESTESEAEPTAEREPVASRAKRDAEPRQASTGLPLQLAEKFASAYEAAGLQRVNVARNINELPANLRKKLSGFGDDVRGAYFPSEDQVWVFSDKVGSPNELAFVVMHEAFHRGLGTLLGDNSKRLLRQMYATNKKLRDRADSVAAELKIDKDTAIEEALADMAGEGDASKLRGWSRLAKMITDWLNTIGEAVGIKRTYSDKDIETFVSAMARAGINEDPDAQSLRDGFDPEKVNQEPEEGVKASRAATIPLPRNEPTTEAGSNTRAGWKLGASTRLDDIVYEIQDKLVDTKQAVQAIRDAGRQIRDDFNPYLQEELYHGRAAKQAADFLDKEVKPLMAEMGRIGVSMKSLEKFLHARHAEERNEQIAKVNPEMPDGGSGMQTADARKYLQELSAPERARLEKLAAKVDAITSGTREYLVETGLESREAVKAWDGAYKHYVPLQRADVDADGSMRGTGTGFSIKGSASKRAMGSSREVDNIIANVVMQRERAITRAEKNRVATAVYGLAIQAPNKGFWMPVDPDANQRTPAELKALEAELVGLGMNPEDAESVFKEPKQRYVDAKTGLVSERINPSIRSSDNVLALRVNGKDRFVFFSDQDPRAMRMVTALKNLDAPQMGEMMGLAARITRYFSAINTSYNPIFGVVNLIRDFQSALFNQSTTAIAGQEKAVARHVPAALKGIMLALRARRAGETSDSAWASLFDEFEKAGGRTGYRDMYATAKDRADALETELKRASSEEGKGIAGFRAAFGMLEDYNDTMENALRLSAYKVAKDSGLTPEQAASLAKNLTVNFNRKGHLTSQVGALYAFFNASAQGTARLVETMKGPRGKKILVGGMLLGAVQALLLAAAGFDEDQPPEFVRERNFIIPIGDGKYLTVPMPLGLHVIPNMTRIPMEWALGGFKDTGSKITSLMGVFLDSFNPIGNAGWSIQTVTPTILDPFVALSENKDFAGRPIAKEDFGNAETPGFTRKKDTASLWAQGMSYAINWLTGGTDFKPGAFSPTPDSIDYLIGQVTGGVGRELSKVFQSGEAAVSGELGQLPSYKIPLFGRLFGDSKEASAVSGAYYENLREMRLHAQEIKGRREAREDVSEYLSDNPEARLAPLAASTEKRVSNLRKLRRSMIERGTFTDEQVAVVDRRIAEEMKRFNERIKAQQDD